MAYPITQLSNSNTLVAVSTPLEAALDIIVVHGMNVGGNQTHAEATWTHDSTGVNWLNTLLPDQLPAARIMAFQYNANIAFGSSIAGVEEQATNMLECLKLKRKLDPTRPILFMAHSLGGIIVKEALAIAFREHEAYPMIWTFTYAIFFLAVPHRGSDHASWGQAIANIHLALTGQPKNSFLESVRQNSHDNEVLNSRFKPLHEAYKFYSWVEGLPLPPWGIIVSKDSATLGLPAGQETCRTTQRDHRTICKFSGADDPEWIELSAHIVEAAELAIKSFDYSPSIQHRRVLNPRTPQGRENESFTLLEASNEAQRMIKRVDEFRNGEELQRKLDEAENAKENIWTLATLLLFVLVPILNLLTSSSLNWVLGNIALSGIVAVLPSKEQALEKAREGQEAEQKIMEVETWAIDKLNNHSHGTLRASHILKQAISLRQLEDQNDMSILQLSHARNLQLELQERAKFITKDIHERCQSYNRAEAVWNKIEDARKEAASKDKKEFWITTAEIVQKERAAQETAPKSNTRECPCVIL